jgi:hypothetical protein
MSARTIQSHLKENASSPVPLAERLKAAAQALREQADLLDTLARAECMDFVTRRTSGLSGRGWDMLIKAGLRTVRVGREKAARWTDFVAAMERPGPPPPAKPEDAIEEMLKKAGIRLNK